MAAQKRLSVYGQYSGHWTTDIGTMMACYFAVGERLSSVEEFSGTAGPSYMFPVLATSTSPSKVLTERIKVVCSKANISNEGNSQFIRYPDDVTGTSIRVTAIETIQSNPKGSPSLSVILSGHEWKNMCSLYEYTYAYPTMVNKAARIMAKYPAPGNIQCTLKIEYINGKL